MIVNGQRVDLEVQVSNEGDYPERVMLYWAREFSTALFAGQSDSMLPRTMIVSIIDFDLFDCTEFHSFFQPLEVTCHTLLSDKMGLHFFELRKLLDDISEKKCPITVAVAVPGGDRGRPGKNQENGGADHGESNQCVLYDHSIARVP